MVQADDCSRLVLPLPFLPQSSLWITGMTDTRKTVWRRLGGGMAISLLLHALAVAVFLLSFDSPIELAEKEQAVEVTLVPPPPEPETEPEPEVSEETAQPEPPTPTPEPEPAPEPPPVPEPLQQQTEVEQPVPSEAPVPTARPLLRLADRDQSPKPSEGIEQADRAATSAGPEPETPSDLAKDSQELPDVALPEAPAADQSTALNDEDETSAGADDTGGSKASIIAETPSDAAEEEVLEPREVANLLSHSYSEDEVATVSMAGMTREERVMDLCGSELSLQLRSGSPRYDVEYLPSFKAETGNVVSYPQTAFRQRDGTWFDLAVVCEVDEKATRVLRFAYSVGKRVPRSEWQARGLFGS
jgi:outer membrane biosynthesis protein TonB